MRNFGLGAKLKNASRDALAKSWVGVTSYFLLLA
jgi:hypothetical protein